MLTTNMNQIELPVKKRRLTNLACPPFKKMRLTPMYSVLTCSDNAVIDEHNCNVTTPTMEHANDISVLGVFATEKEILAVQILALELPNDSSGEQEEYQTDEESIHE